MHEGWQYVAAAYGLSGLTLATWFAMILGKLRRARTRTAAPQAAAPWPSTHDAPAVTDLSGRKP